MASIAAPLPASPPARNHLPSHLGVFRFEGRDGETGLRHGLPHVGGGLEEPGKVVQHLLRSRAGKNGHQRAATAIVIEERFVELVPPHFVEEGMADKRRIAAALAEPRLFERQAAQHVIAQPAHLPGPPGCPGPDLRWRIIENRDAVDLGPPGNPPIEAGVVDQHDGVGPVLAEIAIGASGQVPELVKIGDGPAEPHDGQLGQIGMELATDGRHLRTSVSDGIQLWTALLQLANEVGGMQVAAGLTGREEETWGWSGHAAKYRRFPEKAEEGGKDEGGRRNKASRSNLLYLFFRLPPSSFRLPSSPRSIPLLPLTCRRRGIMESLEGQLLLASPQLLDPNFVRTVVLLIEHNDMGALGLVINRPTGKTVQELGSRLAKKRARASNQSIWAARCGGR